MENNNGKLSNLIRTGFMLPNIGLNLFIYLELYYMSYFLTDICGFSLGVVTFILTSTAAVDLVWVFITGIVLEKCNFKKWGKYRAWYVIASPVIVIFFSIMFLDMGSSMIAAAIVIVSFCIKTLFQDIISAALTGQLSQMTDSVEEREILSARRNQGAIIGQLAFSLIAVPFIAYAGKFFSNAAMGYTIAAIVFTVINGVCHWVLFAVTKDAPVAVSETVSAGSEKLSVGKMFKVLFTNTPLLIISFGDLLRYTAIFLTSSTAAYYFSAVLKDAGAISIYMTAQTIVGLIAAIVVNPIMKLIGKKATYVAGTLIYGVSLIIAYFIGGEGTVMFFIIIMSIGFFFNSLIGTVVTAMTSDTVIYTMWKDKINARGFIMSMLNIPIKFGSMIKSIILPVGLSAVGYVAGAETTSEVANGIGIIMCLASGICVIVSCISILFGYKLSEKRVKEMTQEIQEN